jgi:predicted lipoprotein with Yx(FWY)xxD motif
LRPPERSVYRPGSEPVISIVINRFFGARILIGGSLAVIAGIALAACGSTPAASSTPSPSSSAAAKSNATPTPTPAASASLVIKTAATSDLGTILVNSQGRTLYILTSQTGGRITCTVASGCTAYWSEVDLPSGVSAASAGGSANSALLGTEAGATGTVVTYNGMPLYTFSGDSGPGQESGQGISSFGGTWYVLSAAGNPVTGMATPTPSASSGGGGY